MQIHALNRVIKDAGRILIDFVFIGVLCEETTVVQIEIEAEAVRSGVMSSLKTDRFPHDQFQGACLRR